MGTSHCSEVGSCGGVVKRTNSGEPGHVDATPLQLSSPDSDTERAYVASDANPASFGKTRSVSFVKSTSESRTDALPARDGRVERVSSQGSFQRMSSQGSVFDVSQRRGSFCRLSSTAALGSLEEMAQPEAFALSRQTSFKSVSSCNVEDIEDSTGRSMHEFALRGRSMTVMEQLQEESQERLQEFQVNVVAPGSAEAQGRTDEHIMARSSVARRLSFHAGRSRSHNQLSFAPSSAPGSDGEAPEENAPVAPAPAKRRNTLLRRSRSLISEIGRRPSMALQLIVENPREITTIYKLAKGEIGHGSFGSVRRASVKITGAVRAVKTVSKERMAETMGLLKMEIKIMKLVDHPHVVKLYEIFEDVLNLHLVMELCLGGHLHARVMTTDGFDDRTAALTMRQILSAVQYLHKQRICHRDLKPENVLVAETGVLNPSSLKVTDFGVSCRFKLGQSMKARVGTAEYMSPQVVAKNYTSLCDIWSCGIIMYFLFCTSVPFEGTTREEVRDLVARGKIKIGTTSDWEKASTEAMVFIKLLLTNDEVSRISAKSALEHKWLCRPGLQAKPVPLPVSLIKTLRDFRNFNKLKRASLCVMASLLSKEQTKHFREAFLALDLDGDGYLRMTDIVAKLKREVIAQGHPAEAQNKIIKELEQDSDGLADVAYTEFLAATLEPANYTKPKFLMAAFATFDHDSDERISKEELLNGDLLGTLSTEESLKLVRDFDLNKDGDIDFEEFSLVMIGNGNGHAS